MEMALNIQEKAFTIQKKLHEIVKSEESEAFCLSKLLNSRQKWVAGVLTGIATRL